MTRSVTVLATALALMGASAGSADPRLETRLYQPSEIVTLNGRAGVESAVTFGEDEHIENIAVGDSAAWQVTPNKRANLLFVKPVAAAKRTNMTVVTDQRTYLFDLVAAGRAPPVYMLRFSYRDAPKPKIVALPVEAVTPAAPPAPAAPDPATLRFAWTARGDKALLPDRVFDDGKDTFLAWNKDAPLPAILTRAASGAEGPVNYTTRGDYIVVDGVPAQLVLRAGKQVATLTPETTRLPEPKADITQRAIADARPSRPFAHVLDGRP